jgi:hypothetical protein
VTVTDSENYLNSPLPGCEPAPAWPTVADLADLLMQECAQIPQDDVEARYMLRELEHCLRRGRADQEQLARFGRMCRELSRLWSRHHGPGWLLTPKAEQALDVAEHADVLRQRQELAADAGDDGPDLISDAGEGC